MFDSTIGQVRNLVALVLEKHGIRASTVAQHQALKARSDGNTARAITWEEVARIAEQTLKVGGDP